MKKTGHLIVLTVLILACGFVILNTEMTTRQGYDYQIRVIKIPLYLKALDFFDRHYNYKMLTGKITFAAKTKEEKAIKLLEWTYRNIKRNPKELPVIDDHVWHIIVRGYGVDGQHQDVFTTLCNYAGLDAFFFRTYSDDKKDRTPLSFVKLDNGWAVFDAYNGVYFENLKGKIANVDELSCGEWKAVSITGDKAFDNYSRYFRNLNSVDFKRWNLKRAAIQSPARRLIYSISNTVKQ